MTPNHPDQPAAPDDVTHRLACGLSASRQRAALPAAAELQQQLCFTVCLHGHAQLDYGGASLRLQRHELLATAPGAAPPRHAAAACAQHVCLWLPADVLLELAEARGEACLQALHARAAPCIAPADADTVHSAGKLFDGLHDACASRLLRDAWSLELLARVLACQQRTDGDALSRAQRERLAQARRLLLADFAKPPSAEALARACGLSVFGLKQGFRQLYGQSLHAVFQHERLQAAWQLIAAGAMDVGAAGHQVGYSNLSHFSEAFRRRYGLLPSELKRCTAQQPATVARLHCGDATTDL